MAVTRDLIKVSSPLSVEAVVVDVFTDVLSISGVQELRFDDRPKELLKGHAVVREKARHSSGRGQHDAQPACSFLSYNIPQEQIHPRGDTNGKDRAEELTGRQAEEDALLVLPDFFRDFNLFYDYSSYSCENLTGF